MHAIIINHALLGAIAATAALLILEFLPPAWRRAFFVLVVFITLIPYLLHADWTFNLRSSWEPALVSAGRYRVLYAILALSGLVAGGLSVGAFFMSRKLPELAAGVPIAMGALYWKFLLPALYRNKPTGTPWHSEPLIALFIYTWIAASILLLVAARLRVLTREGSPLARANTAARGAET